MYDILLGDGRRVRKHIDQLRKRYVGEVTETDVTGNDTEGTNEIERELWTLEVLIELEQGQLLGLNQLEMQASLHLAHPLRKALILILLSNHKKHHQTRLHIAILLQKNYGGQHEHQNLEIFYGDQHFY
jgi:hypothetical protein